MANPMNVANPQSKLIESDLSKGGNRAPMTQDAASSAPIEGAQDNSMDSASVAEATRTDASKGKAPAKDLLSEIKSEKDSQNEIASTQKPVDRPLKPAQNSDSEFELLRWLFPALVFIALLIALFIANRRRNRPAMARIDTTKPIRGAFRNRKSNLSEESNEPMVNDSTTTKPYPGSAAVAATEDEPEEFNLDSLDSDSERDSSETKWSEANSGADLLFEPDSTDSNRLTELDQYADFLQPMAVSA